MLIEFVGDGVTGGAESGGGCLCEKDKRICCSYPGVIAAQLGASYSEKAFDFVCRAGYGDTVQELSMRWQRDVVSLCPDLLSVMIGVNDAKKEYQTQKDGGIYRVDFERTLSELISDVRAVNPAVRLLIAEPFLLDTGEAADDGEYRALSEIMKLRQTSCAVIAKRYGAVFLPLQELFEHTSVGLQARFWAWDGCHPTAAGCGLIARAWTEAAKACLGL